MAARASIKDLTRLSKVVEDLMARVSELENLSGVATHEEMPISIIKLEEKVEKSLEIAGYVTVSQLKLATDTALRSVKGVGPASLMAIRRAINDL